MCRAAVREHSGAVCPPQRAEEARLASDHGSLHPQRPSGWSPHQPLIFFAKKYSQSTQSDPAIEIAQHGVFNGEQLQGKAGTSGEPLGHRGAVFCALLLWTTRGSCSTNLIEDQLLTTAMKKGAGASPLFLRTDPPKNQIPVEVGIPATPGSQSCKQRCRRKRANGVPACHTAFMST